MHVLQFIVLLLMCKEGKRSGFVGFRHMSHLTNTLLIVHQSFAGETEDTTS